MHNFLFCVQTLCLNYATNTFLLVSSSVRSKQLLCSVHGQGQTREQKLTKKTFVKFHNHSPLRLNGKTLNNDFFSLFAVICTQLPINGTPDNSNLFQFSLKVRVSESRLYIKTGLLHPISIPGPLLVP